MGSLFSDRYYHGSTQHGPILKPLDLLIIHIQLFFFPGIVNQTVAPVQQAVVIQGQEPLTASMLAGAPPQEQKQMLGERLFPLIQMMYPDLAGKITGMLLEIDNTELLNMLEHHDALKNKVEEALAVLQAHQATQGATQIKKE